MRKLSIEKRKDSLNGNAIILGKGKHSEMLNEIKEILATTNDYVFAVEDGINFDSLFATSEKCKKLESIKSFIELLDTNRNLLGYDALWLYLDLTKMPNHNIDYLDELYRYLATYPGKVLITYCINNISDIPIKIFSSFILNSSYLYILTEDMEVSDMLNNMTIDYFDSLSEEDIDYLKEEGSVVLIDLTVSNKFYYSELYDTTNLFGNDYYGFETSRKEKVKKGLIISSVVASVVGLGVLAYKKLKK